MRAMNFFLYVNSTRDGDLLSIASLHYAVHNAGTTLSHDHIYQKIIDSLLP